MIKIGTRIRAQQTTVAAHNFAGGAGASIFSEKVFGKIGIVSRIQILPAYTDYLVTFTIGDKEIEQHVYSTDLNIDIVSETKVTYGKYE